MAFIGQPARHAIGAMHGWHAFCGQTFSKQ